MSNLVKSSADDTERSPISGVAVAWHVLQPNSASDEIPSFPRIGRRSLPPRISRRPRLTQAQTLFSRLFPPNLDSTQKQKLLGSLAQLISII